MHVKKQVYWDVNSYIHIALRHLNEYQLGHFKLKTPFPYKTEDLKSLIENVLQRIDREIEDYLGSSKTNDFTRHGKMGVEYNRDHYHLRINKDGKLIQFHSVEPTFNNSMQLPVNAPTD